MSHLQQLQLIAQLREQINYGSQSNTLRLLDLLERQITRAEERAARSAKHLIWGRCWISNTPPGPRPIWEPLDDEIEVVTLHTGDPDNLDRLCSNMVLAAEALLSEQDTTVQAVRVRVLLSAHDSKARAHRLPLDYITRRTVGAATATPVGSWVSAE